MDQDGMDPFEVMMQMAQEALGIEPEKMQEIVKKLREEVERDKYVPLDSDAQRAYLESVVPMLYPQPVSFVN